MMQRPTDDTQDEGALTLAEYTDILNEIEDQPPWRGRADKEMDYIDGNQLDTELMQKQRSLGIPPAMENVMKPAIQAVIGFEAKTRTDWRVTPDGDVGGRDVADALNFKLNQAEKQSKADKACGDAFKSQFSVGLGWVEVSRESDPFKFPYRCRPVHRNEIFFDMKGEPDLSDAGWLLRRKWTATKRLKLMFPQHRDLIEHCSGRWTDRYDISREGGASTGLQNSWATERGWSIEEQRWYNASKKEACISELWYRRWVSVPVLKSPDGRVVEYDAKNEAHNYALATGVSKVTLAVIPRVRRAYWLGPHCLHDGPTPYGHRYFPYVPFWGDREDVTGVPYGAARHMIYAQDSLNSGISKLRWGMSSVRTTYTDGVTDMTDAQLAKVVGRVDARIKLKRSAMAEPGALFKVERDFQLSDQHYKMLQDNRASIERSTGITNGFMGRDGSATSGLQEQTQVEQSAQSMAGVMDNFKCGRTMVGEILLSFIIEDLGSEQAIVVIEGDAVRKDRTVVVNKPETDPETGVQYLSNDVQRTRLKVALEDVPTTSSFRAQQLNALSEAVKSMTPEMQKVCMPYLFGLMDMPYQRELIEAIRAAADAETPEAVEERIKAAVQEALDKAGIEIKRQELAIKERKTDAEIGVLDAEKVLKGVQSEFSAMQGGAQVAANPQIAPIADELMKAAGYQAPSPGGDDPNFPTPGNVPLQPGPAPQGGPDGESLGFQPQAVRENTSPGFPPVPSDGESPMKGIETPSMADNFSGAE